MAMSEELRSVRVSTDRVNTTRQRRTLDERLLVRFPRLARAVGRGFSRLSTHSRLRRAGLVRLASQASSAVNRRDFDVLFSLFDPGMSLTLTAGENFPPDLVGEHHGYAGYREVWRGMLEAIPDLRLEPVELIDCGDVLVSETRMSGHGGGSGIPFSQAIWQVYWLRDGLIARQHDFREREEALDAARQTSASG
jgi:hypothetical protein